MATENNNNKSVMEKISCTTEPITEGFEYCWTIDRCPRAFAFSLPMRTPVFSALGRCWAIEASLWGVDRLPQLCFELFQVDESGGVKIEGIEDTPYFKNSHFQGRISLFTKDGGRHPFSHGPMERISPLKLKLKPCDYEDTQRLFEILNGQQSTIGSIQIAFELCVVVARSDRCCSKSTTLGLEQSITPFDMKKMFEAGKFTDFLIRTGDGGEIRAHRAVLSQTAPYFEAMFNAGGLEAEAGEMEVPEPFHVANEIVHFLYAGKLSSAEIKGNQWSAVELYTAADKYQVSALKKLMEEGANVAALFSVESVCSELVKAHLAGVECIKKKSAEFIRAHQKTIVETEDWARLCAKHPTLVAYIIALPPP